MIGTASIIAIASASGFIAGRMSRPPQRLSPLLAATAALAHQTSVTGQVAGVSIEAGRAMQFGVSCDGLPDAIIDATRPNALSDTLQMMVDRDELLMQLVESKDEQQTLVTAET